MTTNHNKSSGNKLSAEVDRIETMINSPEVRNLRSRNRESIGYVRPRNAATMILIDGTADNPRILMGKRNKKLKFMPGALVFPGGSVDRYDGSVGSFNELTYTTQDRLMNAMRGRPTQRSARSLGIAAIREVAEESGLLIGKSGDFADQHQHWADFRKSRIIPSLDGIRLFARAITPPGMARRFDTWFFLAHRDEVGFTPKGGFAPDGELEDLQWISPEQAITGNTREITRVMLVELLNRLRQDKNLSDDFPAPFYHTKGSRFTKAII